MQCDSPDQLDIEMAQADRPFGRFADSRERFRQASRFK